MPHAGEAPPTTPNPSEFRWEAARGEPGFFRAVPDTIGRWWLVDAQDGAFFCRAVHGVRAMAPTDAANDALGAASGVVVPDPAARLRRWGFNAVGAGGRGVGQADGLAFFATADFCQEGPLIRAPGARLPDVFASDWPRRAADYALTVCAPLAEERAVVGWLSDDDLGWAQPAPAHSARPTLLQICLSLEPGFAAYHAAWEFTLALHGGKIAAVARAWGVPLANKEVLRELTRTEQGIATRGYLRDTARWTREFARRYFAATSAAIRAADPHHLLLGARSAGPAGDSVRAEGVYPSIDVPLIGWNELPAAAAGTVASGPVLADNVCWTDEEFLRAPAGTSRRLTTVERMLRRGRAALERAARHPAVVGYVWRQWLDEPGEEPPFASGLVHANGAEAREHTELLAEINARAMALRCAPAAEILSV